MRFRLSQVPRGRVASRVRRAGAEKRRTRFLVEGLESRALLATLTVGPTLDISKMAGDQSEEVVTINKANPKNLVAISNQLNGNVGLFKAISNDGGLTWTTGSMADGTDLLTTACCDPSAQSDQFGNIFVSYLDQTDSNAVLTVSTDGGKTFKEIEKVSARDQPKIAVGPGGSAATSSIWMEYADSALTVSLVGAPVTGLGQIGTFIAPENTTDSNGANFGKLSVGPQGQVLISYENPSGGQGPAVLSAQLDPDGLGPATLSPAIPIANVNVGGFYPIPAQSQRTIDSEVDLAYDYTTGPHRGRVYAVYTDSPSVGSGATTIFMKTSDDNGTTWSAAKKVNDDTTQNSHFFPRVKVDPVSGNVGVSWYDCRNDPGNQKVQVFATVSTDGGQTFAPNVQVSSGSSNAVGLPDPNQYGDYSGLDFYNNVLQPIWASNDPNLAGNPDLPNLDIATATVTVLSLTPQPITFNAPENVTFSGTVGSFLNNNGVAKPGDYTATIDWGNGNTSTGTVTQPGGAGTPFVISGTNLYGEGGTYPVTITVTGNGASVTIDSTANVADAPLTLVSTSPGSAVEGQAFGGLLATFSDADPAATFLTSYTVTLKYDDGTTGTAVVQPSQTGGFNTYDIFDSNHIYEDGNHTVTFTIVDSGNATLTGTTTVSVTDAPLTAGPPTAIQPTEGQLFRGIIGTFSDAYLDAPLSDYTATVTWGDGHTSNGVVDYGPGGPGTGQFVVYGSNTYGVLNPTDPGTGNPVPYPIGVVLSDRGGKQVSLSSSAVITPAPLTAGPAASFTAVEGGTVQGTITSFTTPNFLAQAGQYQVLVDWGDGTAPTAGTLTTQPGQTKTFFVSGGHTYAEEGTYTINAVVHEIGAPATGPGNLAIPAAATVTDAPISVAVIGTPPATEATPFTGAVATVVDANPNAPLSDFAAVINWGDGSPATAGTLKAQGGGVFAVSGGHTYADSGSYNVTVTVGDVGGSSASTTGAVIVNDLIVPMTGSLDQASDSGASNADDITNVTQPYLSGTGEANTTVRLYGEQPGDSAPTLIAVTNTDASGHWHVGTAPLADGRYVVTATSTDAGGHTTPPAVLLGGGLLWIDTSSPVVSDVTFNGASNQLVVSFQDTGSGLFAGGLLNAANYNVTRQGRAGASSFVPVTGLTLLPTGGLNSMTVALSLGSAGRRGSRSSTYVVTVSAQGITDIAGNRLDGSFAGSFPTGNHAPGTDFQAVVTTNGVAPAIVMPVTSALDLQGALAHQIYIRSRTPGQLVTQSASFFRRGSFFF